MPLLSNAVFSKKKRMQFSRSRRFQEHFEIVKFKGTQPGPLDYEPKNDLFNKTLSSLGIKFKKPVLIDEGVYEIVGGTTKVLRPDLLSKIQQKRMQTAGITFVRQRNSETVKAKSTLNPARVS